MNVVRYRYNGLHVDIANNMVTGRAAVGRLGVRPDRSAWQAIS